MSAQCPADCDGCICAALGRMAPCNHCVEHGCPECGEHGCTDDECGKPPPPAPRKRSVLPIVSMMAAAMAGMGSMVNVFGLDSEGFGHGFGHRKTRRKESTKRRNQERDRKAKAAAKKRRKKGRKKGRRK